MFYLNFLAESLHQILIDDAIGSSKEGKNVLDKVALTIL